MPHAHILTNNCGVCSVQNDPSSYMLEDVTRLNELSASLVLAIQAVLNASSEPSTDSASNHLLTLAGDEPDVSLSFSYLHSQFFDGSQLHFYLDHPTAFYAVGLPDNDSYTSGIIGSVNLADLIFETLPSSGAATAISGNVATIADSILQVAGGQRYEIVSAETATNGELLILRAIP